MLNVDFKANLQPALNRPPGHQNTSKWARIERSGINRPSSDCAFGQGDHGRWRNGNRMWSGMVLVLAVVAGCESDDCSSNQDCPSGRYQCIDRRCVLPEDPSIDFGVRTTPDLGFADFGPTDEGFRDGGFPDFGFRDLGVQPNDPRDAEPMDDGSPSDVDAGDGGAGDTDAEVVDASDASFDGGFVDAGLPGPPTDTEALVNVALVQVSLNQTDQVAEARIVDYSLADRTLVVTSRDGCTIRERGVGAPFGLTATRIELRNGTAAIDLVPTGTSGVFESGSQTMPEQLFGNTAISYRVVSSDTPGTLDSVTVSTAAPVGPLLPATPPETTLAFAAVSLAPFSSQGVNRFEVYDADRRAVVTCPVDATSGGLPFWIPSLYEPGLQVTLDIRNEAETTVDVEVIDRGPVPVTFRAARTVRYTVQLP